MPNTGFELRPRSRVPALLVEPAGDLTALAPVSCWLRVLWGPSGRPLLCPTRNDKDKTKRPRGAHRCWRTTGSSLKYSRTTVVTTNGLHT